MAGEQTAHKALCVTKRAMEYRARLEEARTIRALRAIAEEILHELESAQYEVIHSHAIVRACNSHEELLVVCKQVVAWLGRLAERAEQQADSTGFESLRDACAADAKNYRATAADVERAIASAALPATPAQPEPPAASSEGA